MEDPEDPDKAGTCIDCGGAVVITASAFKAGGGYRCQECGMVFIHKDEFRHIDEEWIVPRRTAG